MSRLAAALLVAVTLVPGCGKSIRNKEKVQEAIINRLQTKSGLDLNSLDITTTSVSFQRDMAYATVAFHPKTDPNITSGMVMKYTLEARDGNWIVVNVADSQGRGLPGHPAASANQLPPGHPPIDGSTPSTVNPHAGLPAQGGAQRP